METRQEPQQRMDPTLLMAITQSVLAVLVVLGTVLLMILRSFAGAQFAIPSEWWTMSALVVGYFFGARTQGGNGGGRALVVALMCAALVSSTQTVLR